MGENRFPPGYVPLTIHELGVSMEPTRPIKRSSGSGSSFDDGGYSSDSRSRGGRRGRNGGGHGGHGGHNGGRDGGRGRQRRRRPHGHEDGLPVSDEGEE